MSTRPKFFLRFAPEDRPEREAEIVRLQELLKSGLVEETERAKHLIDLGSLLTSCEREGEAVPILREALDQTRANEDRELLGWALLHLATAEQYARASQNAQIHFDEALMLARSNANQELLHYTLHHLGRFLAEQQRKDEARAAFAEALAIRMRLGDPRAQSSQRALAALEGFG